MTFVEVGGLAEVTQENILDGRYQSALDAVRKELEKDVNFKPVQGSETEPSVKFSSAIWRTQIYALNKDWTVDICLPKRFPDEAPIAYVRDWENLFLRNPHVLKGGVLCTIPGSAALNNSDPVGLVQYVYEKAQEILNGTNPEDFKEEFSYYWSRCTTDNAQVVLIIDPIDQLKKTFPAIFFNSHVFVASSIEKLNRWVSNYIGKESNLSNGQIGIRIDLGSPLLPQNYPNSLEDLISLCEANDDEAAGLMKTHIVKNRTKGLALLVQKEGKGFALGGVVFNGLGLSQSKLTELTRGFRPGHVPENLLLERAGQRIRSTNISRNRVIHADHDWIHSRGGDGRNLSQKKVLLIGCGSLGGYVAHMLSRAGVGHLTVTDNDFLGWENLGRHVLGASSIASSKAEAIAEKLTQELPHLDVIGIPKDWRDIYESNNNIFAGQDLVISTVADWRCEGPLNTLKRKIEMPPLLLGWLEAHAVAGHCLVISKKGGCFECGVNEYGQFHDCVATFQESMILREPGGCAHYQQYGPTALMPVASMISTIAIESLINPPEESCLSTWISSKNHFESVRATLTDKWAAEIAGDGYSKTFKKTWLESKTCSLCQATRS